MTHQEILGCIKDLGTIDWDAIHQMHHKTIQQLAQRGLVCIHYSKSGNPISVKYLGGKL